LFELGNGQWNIPRLRLLLEELLPRGNRIESFEVAHEFPSLGYRNMALNAREVRREANGPKTILLAIEDITDRVRAEERLRIRELTSPDAASQTILSVDSNGRIVMANRMAETMFGYSREELLELPLEALVPERFRDAHAVQHAGYFAAPRLRPMGHGLELSGRRKDGTEFPAAIALTHMHTRDGMLAVAYITDLTGQRHAEEALRESEERFSQFMNHLPAAAFMKDLEGRYVYVNPGFGKLTSQLPARCLGASDREFWPESAIRLRVQDLSVMQTGHAVTAEDVRTADGKLRHFQTVSFPIPNAHGQAALVAGITVEITERKRAELERQELLARLATAQEEERRRISRELHDDLTQRLARLAMDLGGLAAERPASPAVLKKSLRGMQRRVVQAAEITRHIAHELHPSELDDLGLVAALRSYSEEFARHEGIEVGFASRNVPKELNREIASCLYKITQESLTNVSKHSGAKLVSVVLDGTADRIRLRVKDAGAGFQFESRAAKVGLGILSMKERAELLHGKLTIASQPGRGTEVIVELPLGGP
jgi:PAS domain S-box-containing protein